MAGDDPPANPAQATIPDHSAALEADEFENDSALGIDDEFLSTASLASSIYHYKQENGRLYHSLSAGKYFMPSDDEEVERLDMQNHHFRLTFGGRQFFCPGGENAKRVLDIGTGSGIWAIEYADDHPGAEVIGVDLSPIQPNFVPPNCRFEVDDVEKDWTWDKPFDYIFCRMMIGSFADWTAITKTAFDNLEPGGWVEFIDNGYPIESDDSTLTPDLTITQFDKLIVKAAANLGRPLDVAKTHKTRLQECGFVNIQTKLFKWPTNPWPKAKELKEIGLWTLANIEKSLEGISMALFTRGLGWSRDEVLAYIAAVRKDMRNPRIHAWWPIIVTYGQKPKPTETGN